MWLSLTTHMLIRKHSTLTTKLSHTRTRTRARTRNAYLAAEITPCRSLEEVRFKLVRCCTFDCYRCSSVVSLAWLAWLALPTYWSVCRLCVVMFIFCHCRLFRFASYRSVFTPCH